MHTTRDAMDFIFGSGLGGRVMCGVSWLRLTRVEMENDIGFPQLKVMRKTGDERFNRSGNPLDLNLLGFWRWSASDLVSNATRGILAEYIVANALGLAKGVRAEWDAFDLLTESGVKVEVKSAAYLQSWYHKELSKITFGIRPTRLWDASTNVLATELKRQADIYIFCVLSHKEKDSLDPLNLDQWDFYVVRAALLDEKFPTQKSIGLSSLLKLNPCVAKYEEIASCVERVSSAIAHAS
jgi:hypothetical protein